MIIISAINLGVFAIYTVVLNMFGSSISEDFDPGMAMFQLLSIQSIINLILMMVSFAQGAHPRAIGFLVGMMLPLIIGLGACFISLSSI